MLSRRLFLVISQLVRGKIQLSMRNMENLLHAPAGSVNGKNNGYPSLGKIPPVYRNRGEIIHGGLVQGEVDGIDAKQLYLG